MEDRIVGSELPRARTTASAIESADNEELELGVELGVTVTVFDDAEEITPAAKLLLVERGGGMLNKQLTPATTRGRNRREIRRKHL